MNEDSYIKLPAALIKELARAKIKEIEAYREREWVQFADKWNRKWWRRLLKLRPMTVEEVKAEAREHFLLFTPQFYCWSQFSRCESLVRLASAYTGEGEVYLSNSDYNTLTQ